MSWTLYDEFAGVGGTSHGASMVPGLDPAVAANHDKDAIDAHTANFPDAKHYHADVTKLIMHRMPYCDVFGASPACFTAGTLILARRGLVPVESIQVGDEVFTHMRRWRPVTATMSRPAKTVIVRGVGMPGGVETTAEHPFYTRRRLRVWKNDIRRWRQELAPSTEWTEAQHLAGQQWATPVDFGEALDVPAVGGRGLVMDADFWWVVGRWLGDGHVRIQPRTSPTKPRGVRPDREIIRSQPDRSSCTRCDNPARAYGQGWTGRTSPFCSDECRDQRTPQPYDPGHQRYDLTICCGKHEADDLAKRLFLGAGELRWAKRETRTSVQLTTSHRGLVEWIAEHFGHGAAGKKIPAWALTMPEAYRAALLAGYVSADGHVGHYTTTSTVSKALAVGTRMLATSLGHVANIKGPYIRPAGRRIEGRDVNELPTWEVAWITAGPEHAFHLDADGYRWVPVRSVTPSGRTAEVFNFSVAEDESYVADGITVHNCPAWTNANGVKVDFDQVNAVKQTLFGGEDEPEMDPKLAKRIAEYKRSRLLMHEVIRYLRGMIDFKGKAVLGGIVENVIQCRLWSEWDAWLGEFHKLDYYTRVIALNSMHAQSELALMAPQSRNRLYVMYWHKSLGRDPDFDKWLRPLAYCPTCDRQVEAMQVFKEFGVDMGDYGVQYVYRCPNVTCRHQEVFPEVLPALTAVDLSIVGTPVGSRKATKKHPAGMAPNTRARIAAGVRKYWEPLLAAATGLPPFLAPTGGTWRDGPSTTIDPMPTRTTRECDGVAMAPLLPFITPFRGGGDLERARSIAEPIHTVTAGGNHHGLAMPPLVLRHYTSKDDGGHLSTPVTEPLRTLTTAGHQSLLTAPSTLLVPYYGAAEEATPATRPVGALTTRDRYGLADYAGGGSIAVDDVLFRMLQPHEIARAMAFDASYLVPAKTKEIKVKLYGNAVTPPVAEVLYSCLMECVSGEPLTRERLTLAA